MTTPRRFPRVAPTQSQLARAFPNRKPEAPPAATHPAFDCWLHYPPMSSRWTLNQPGDAWICAVCHPGAARETGTEPSQ